jgi:hypothetical protein
MPSMQLFDQQSQAYRDEVLPVRTDRRGVVCPRPSGS